MAAQALCLHNSTYEMRVNASTSKVAFGKIVVRLCHCHFHFQQPLLYSQQHTAFTLSLLSHLLNTDETMLTHKLSFVRPELN